MSILPLFLFILYYSIGFAAIFFWRRKKNEPDHFYFQAAWALLAIVLYTGSIERNGLLFYPFGLLFALLFYLSQQSCTFKKWSVFPILLSDFWYLFAL